MHSTRVLPASIRDAVSAFLESPERKAFEPEFNFDIGWCDDYDALFRGQYNTKTGIGQLANAALETGRVMLSARGGGGKTVTIRRIARQLLASDWIPVIIEVGRWSSGFGEQWRHSESSGERMNMLLTELGIAMLSVRMLDRLPPESKRLILVDGLNEVPSTIGQEIIQVLEDYVRYAINTGIVVADRMVRREFGDAKRWRISTVMPLASEEIDRVLQQSTFTASHQPDSSRSALLSSPFFLNSALSIKTASSSSQSMYLFLKKHANLNEDDLNKAASAAFCLYSLSDSRLFTMEQFAAIAGDEVTQKLAKSVFSRFDSRIGFVHHLMHDYLAARYLAMNHTSWTRDDFNRVTFGASSFDVLSMALQQLDKPDEADVFVRRVYDWNLYGAAYAMTDGSTSDQSLTRVSNDAEVAILAMLAIRRWDKILATRTRSEDALSLFPRTRVQPFLEAHSEQEIIDVVASVASGHQWFEQWKVLFASRVTGESEATTLDEIENEDSLTGWTYANVLRRSRLSSISQSNLIRRLSASDNPTIRWRIAHVLGSVTTEDSVVALIERLDHDPDRWVRYGATRSLVELAGTTSDALLRKAVFEKIAERAPRLLNDDKSLLEFQSALFVANAPNDWLESIAIAVESLYDNDENFDRRLKWHQIAAQLTEGYNGAA